MIRYILLITLLVGCGRKRDDINLEKDKENYNVVSSNLDYDHRLERNVHLNKRIKDVTVNIINGNFSREVTVSISPTCLEKTLDFRGEMPNGPYTSDLTIISGNTNVDVAIKCLDGDCSKFIVVVKEQGENPGVYPVLMEERGGVTLNKWSPKHYTALQDKRYMNTTDICNQRDLKFQKKIKLFVDVDTVSEKIDWDDTFNVKEHFNASENEVKRICEEDVEGQFLRKTLASQEWTMRYSLRSSISTGQFEYDDFSYGECIYSDRKALSGDMAIYDIGETEESAKRKVQRHCVNDLNGIVDSEHYQIETHQLGGRSNWIAKIHCKLGYAPKNYFF